MPRYGEGPATLGSIDRAFKSAIEAATSTACGLFHDSTSKAHRYCPEIETRQRLAGGVCKLCLYASGYRLPAKRQAKPKPLVGPPPPPGGCKWQQKQRLQNLRPPVSSTRSEPGSFENSSPSRPAALRICQSRNRTPSPAGCTAPT